LIRFWVSGEDLLDLGDSFFAYDDWKFLTHWFLGVSSFIYVLCGSSLSRFADSPASPYGRGVGLASDLKLLK
jgi:hypothetical protein